MSYIRRHSTPIPGLCEKYGHNRMASCGALVPAFLNAVLFGTQTASDVPSAAVGAALGFVLGSVSGVLSFSGAMKAHEAVEHRLHGRGMSVTRKVHSVYRAQVTAFSLGVTAALGALNLACYGVRQDLRQMDEQFAAMQQAHQSRVAEQRAITTTPAQSTRMASVPAPSPVN